MLKTHYEHGPHGNACGRASARSTTEAGRVTCLACQKSDQFIAAKKVADESRKAAFEAQKPHKIAEPWKQGHIICSGFVYDLSDALSKCGNDLFREGDRSCYGHYQSFHCSKCGHIESRLTETGMSF